jgi:hypothetical protein
LAVHRKSRLIAPCGRHDIAHIASNIILSQPGAGFFLLIFDAVKNLSP